MEDTGFWMSSVAEKHIEGAQRVIERHLGKIRNSGHYGGPEWVPKWLRDIAKHLKNILKKAKKLRGKKRAAAEAYVRKTAAVLRKLAEDHDIPWDF